MSGEKTGGPAFPLQYDPYVDHPVHGRVHRASIGEDIQEGMTLRDYFAAHAPVAPDDWNETLAMRATYVDEQMAIALWRFEYADAMLKAREL